MIRTPMNVREIIENFFCTAKPVMTQPWEVYSNLGPKTFELRYTKRDLERLIQDLESSEPLPDKPVKPVKLSSVRRPMFIQDHQVYISWHYPSSPEWLERFRKHGVRTIERDQTICVHVDDVAKARDVDHQFTCPPRGKSHTVVHYDDEQR